MSIRTPVLGPVLSLPASRPLGLALPLRAWLQVAHERRQLAGMSARELRDIGIDPAQASREALRPFWDLPEDRR